MLQSRRRHSPQTTKAPIPSLTPALFCPTSRTSLTSLTSQSMVAVGSVLVRCRFGVDLLARRSLSEGTGMSQDGEDGIFLLKKKKKLWCFWA